MKRAALFTLILCLTAIFYSSCKEDEYMDWKIMNDRWYLTLEDSLKKDTTNSFFKTSSGLYYKIIHEGYRRHPNPSDIVNIKCTGTLINGSQFKSTAGNYYLPSMEEAGLQEGIRKMKDGGHFIFYMPSKLGYDNSNKNSLVPPYSVLKFDVELIRSESY